MCTLGALLALAIRSCLRVALFCILPAHFVVLNLEIIEYARSDMHSRDMHYRMLFVMPNTLHTRRERNTKQNHGLVRDLKVKKTAEEEEEEKNI